MRPATTSAHAPAAPPGSALPSPKPGAATRRRNPAAGAPLGDVTNLLPLPDTPAPVKLLRRTARRPLPGPAPSAASSTCSSTASVTPAPAKHPSAAAAVLEGESSVFKSPAISTVYNRRGAAEAQGGGRRKKRPTTNTNTTTTTTTTITSTTNKGKEPVAAAAAGTASCPPLGRSTRKTRKQAMDQDPRHISSSAPCPKVKKKRPSPSTPKLPEDFVKKQRAYFADIDAFKLPEEEVSESELD